MDRISKLEEQNVFLKENLKLKYDVKDPEFFQDFDQSENVN